MDKWKIRGGMVYSKRDHETENEGYIFYKER